MSRAWCSYEYHRGDVEYHTPSKKAHPVAYFSKTSAAAVPQYLVPIIEPHGVSLGVCLHLVLEIGAMYVLSISMSVLLLDYIGTATYVRRVNAYGNACDSRFPGTWYLVPVHERVHVPINTRAENLAARGQQKQQQQLVYMLLPLFGSYQVLHSISYPVPLVCVPASSSIKHKHTTCAETDRHREIPGRYSSSQKL